MGYIDDKNADNEQKAWNLISDMPAFAKKYFIDMKIKGLSTGTMLQYAFDLKRFFDWIYSQPGFKDTNWKTVTAEEVLGVMNHDDLAEYASTLSSYVFTNKNKTQISKEMSYAARARKIASLKSFFAFYYNNEEIEKNPARSLVIPKIENEEIKVLYIDEFQRLLDAVCSTEGLPPSRAKMKEKIVKRDKAITLLLFGTGIRISELCQIDIDWIDFKEAKIHNIQTKGKKKRIIPVPEFALLAIEEYIEEERSPLQKNGPESSALFLSMQGKRMSVRSVQDMLAKAAKKAELGETVSPHTLRRTYGTLLYNQTGDIDLVKNALNHKSIQVTAEHYTQVSEERKVMAADITNSLFEEKINTKN